MLGMRAIARDGDRQWDMDSSARCNDGRTNSVSSVKQMWNAGRGQPGGRDAHFVRLR